MDTVIRTFIISVTLLIQLLPALGTGTASDGTNQGAAGQVVTTGAEGEPVPGRPDVTWAGSPDRLAALEGALDLFDRAGLDLPKLHVGFADTREPCGGQNGRFLSGKETDPDAVRHIVVCRRLPVILLHELGHAWERTTTSDETRAEFLDFWGLERWNDIADKWSDRGAEMAAESIAYALTITEPTTNPVMVRYACGFEILTGSTPPVGGMESCRSDDLG